MWSDKISKKGRQKLYWFAWHVLSRTLWIQWAVNYRWTHVMCMQFSLLNVWEKNLRGDQSHQIKPLQKIFSVLQSVFHNLHNKMRDVSTILLLETPGKDYSSWILTSEGAWFPSGLMTAIGLSGWPIKWLVARAATACWFIAFNVGWFALVTAIAKSPAVDGEPCALRYSLSCLFCFCWMK